MNDKAKIAAAIRDDIMPIANEGLSQHKKLTPLLETLYRKLKAASDAGDVDLIDFQINEVKEKSDEVKDCLDSLDTALYRIRELMKDHSDLKGTAGALEAVLKKITNARNSLNDQVAKLNKLEEEANKSRAASAGSVKTRMREATAAWSKLEASIKDTLRENQVVAAKLPAVQALAVKAVEEHDAALLAKARKANDSYTYASTEYAAHLRGRIAEHEKTFDRKLMPPDLTNQFEREKKEWEGAIAAIEVTGLQIGVMKSVIAALEIRAVDGAKAAKELGFPDTAAADVKKLFDGNNAGVAKGLEALGRKYKVKPPPAKDAIALLARKNLR
jgi:DNA repair exonuclease SbcCD ATPase subunit